MKILKVVPLCALFSVTTVQAENYPDLEDEFSVMGALSEHDWHDLKDERWNAYSQATYISSFKSAFPAAYTNLNGTTNSLSPDAEHSFTATYTFYLGFKAWKGGEFFVSPAMISELPLSGLKGLGGSIQNFELQKNGAANATWYLERSYYQHTLSFGGTSSEVKSGPFKLAGTVDSRRLVISAGTFSILDFFDKNTYAGDLRRQFFNMAFMTHAAYDFGADARGYTTGLVAEYYLDQWAFRFGHIAGPREPNQLTKEYDIFKSYGDQVELEHKHVIKDQPGAIRILGFRNLEKMGSFNDAIAAFKADPNKNSTTCTAFNYENGNATAPDLCWVRKPSVKMGIGLNIEQSVTDDIGIFFRGMYSDGKTEVYSYTSTDRSLSFGAAMKGLRWGRSKDSMGLGYAQSWISKEHIAYLNMGGVDGFIGDGKINYQPEQVVDLYYQCHIFSSTWVAFDYQHIANPAFNADRGPLDIYSARIHFEF